jgi:hypothetical protein
MHGSPVPYLPLPLQLAPSVVGGQVWVIVPARIAEDGDAVALNLTIRGVDAEERGTVWRTVRDGMVLLGDRGELAQNESAVLVVSVRRRQCGLLV